MDSPRSKSRGAPVALEPVPESGPLTPGQSAMLCAGCVRCCTYVAVEVDAPDVPWLYDQYIWLLYHRGVWMYVERGNRWYVQFETVCEKLTVEGRCSVHGAHPVLCKDYDPRSCERRTDLAEVRARFFDGHDLEEWMREHRPAHWRRYRAWFDKEHSAKAYALDGHSPAQVLDEGVAAAGNLRRGNRAVAGVHYEMPPPPVNPLLLKTAATRVAYKKGSGANGARGRNERR